MHNVIYFGRKCVGKSTYLSKLSTGFVDFDKFIWTQIDSHVEELFRRRITNCISAGYVDGYRNQLASLSRAIDWPTLLAEANRVSTVYEMPAIGMWWDFLPHELKYNSFLIKIDCDDDVRLERLVKRDCLYDIEKFDQFYVDPPIIHHTIKV